MTEEIPCALAGCPAGRKAIVGLTIYFVVLFIILGFVFILTWASLQDALHKAGGNTILKNIVGTIGTTTPFSATPMTIDGEPTIIIPDSLAVLTVFASGAFGGLIHSIRSMYFHVIEGDFGQADVIKLFLRPFSGAILSLIFYLVLRAGLGDEIQKADDGGSIMFYTAVGALVGMFTDQTVAKLKKIAEAILTKPDAEAGGQGGGQ